MGQITERNRHVPNGDNWDARVSLQGGASDAYNSGSDALRASLVNPPYAHDMPYRVADETGMADGTSDYYVNLHTYKHICIQYEPGGGGTKTLKVYATAETDPDLSAREYRDVTNAAFGAASFTTSSFLADTNGVLKAATAIHIEVVVSGASSDATWTLDVGRAY